MFRRLRDSDAGGATAHSVTVSIDGVDHAAQAGDTVAATLLAAGLDACRTTAVAGVPRGPYCMMGVCFDCLVVIDGQPNRQGCMIAVEDGMRIETQRGARSVGADAAVAAGNDGAGATA